MALPTRQTRPALAHGGETVTSSGNWLMLAALLLGQFMCIIDVLVVNVAMPSIAATLHAGPARARALSAYAAVLSAGAVAGLVLGGVMVTADLFGTGWRPVFAINVPIGIVLAAAVPRLVPPDEIGTGAPAAGRTSRLDLAGLAAGACAVLLIVLPLVLGHDEGWPAWCFGCIAAGAVLAAGFVLIERRVAARSGDPLLNLAVLRAPALPSGLVTLAATQIGYGGLLFAFTLHLQAGLGESALRAGLSYLPMAAVFGLAGYGWRRLPAAARRVLVPAGLAVSTLAYLSLAAGLHGAGPHGAGLHGAGPHGGTGALTWIGLAVAGLGLGLSVSPLLTQSLTHVPAARAADASGLLTTTVQLGQLLGISIESMSNLGNPMNCCMTFTTRSSRILSTLPTGPWLTG